MDSNESNQSVPSNYQESEVMEAHVEADTESRDYDEPRPNSEIVCLFQKCNKIAAASVNVNTLMVKILESCDNFRPDYSLLKKLLHQLSPQFILLNTNSPCDLIVQIQEYCNNHQCTFEKLSSSLFRYTNSKEIIFSTKFKNITDQENYVNSLINTADERLVCVVGALFSQLKEIIPSMILQHVSELEIHSISVMSLENTVWIDSETYKCLQVFDNLLHPSAFKWSSKSYQDNSEGLSIYSIIEKNCCLLGSSRLRIFLSSPLKDCDELKKRHEVIRFCNEARNAKSIHSMKSQMSHLSPIDVLIRNVGCANIRGTHWKCIYQNIYYSVLLAETCKENRHGVQIFDEIASCLTDEMYAMAYHLDRIIDFQNMEGNEMFIVKHGVSDSLENAKAKFSKLMDVINKVVPYEFDAVPNYINKIHMLYIPEMKFLLSIPFWKKNLQKEELDLPGLEYKFTSNKTAYYKTKRCYELDELLGDPQIEIMMEEANIIRALGKYIKKNIGISISLIEKIADLDCLFSLATLSKEYDYVEPVLNNENKIIIKDGVHPLLQMCTNEFIPNSIESSPETSLVKIIYGPNASGKTVYLKQVALLSYLAHIGSFIPAKGAHIGLCSQIHTRLSSAESIISESSSFMNDLRKLAAVVNGSHSSSLLILDEIGRGTTELNGTAILASCLNHFLSLGPESPHVIVSTHLTSVSDYIETCDNLFSVQVMNYTIEEGKYIFLYKVKGQEDVSFFNIEPNMFPEIPGFISESANRVLFALRSGENVTPYTVLRLRKCQRYYSFLKKFSRINSRKEGIIDKLRRKLKSLMS